MPAILYILFAILVVVCASYFLRLRRLVRRSNATPRIISRHNSERLHFLRG